MIKFSKIPQRKRFALNNSYFKNRLPSYPADPFEVYEYFLEHGELPFIDRLCEIEKHNWLYHCFVEYQKKAGVQNSQYFTPIDTASRLVELALKYFPTNDVLEPCCGFGMITNQLLVEDFNVLAFDNDEQMIDLCRDRFRNKADFMYSDFQDFEQEHTNRNGFIGMPTHINQIVANPPYEVLVLTKFLQWILSIQSAGGLSVLLLPKGFMQKSSPKALVAVLNKFTILEMEDMREEFAQTKTRAEIAVLRKL